MYEKAYELSNAILGSDVYKRFINARESLKKHEDLCAKANEYRHKNFMIQNSTSNNRVDELRELENEYRDILRNTIVREYLNAELLLCRTIQKINEIIVDGLDRFFNKKAEFFKGLKDTYSANLEKKQQLVNKAKELADSTDWKKTGDKFIALQKEWKKVGTVPHKQGELLWKEFLDTCNKFFEARNKQNAGSRSEEHANLDKKRNIIAQLKELVVAEISDNDFQKKLKDLAKQYSAIGHVPFKEKDKVYKEYHEAIDAAYKKLHATNAKRHFDNFKNNLKNVAKEGGNALGNERGKLLRRYDQLRSEITTYENNLGFFNTASKKGNSLVEEMNRKIEKLKADLEMVKQKIKAIDAEKK